MTEKLSKEEKEECRREQRAWESMIEMLKRKGALVDES